jgi:phage gp36-like protein
LNVLTSATAYATATDLINAHDAGKIGDYAKDGAQLTPNQILTDTKVAAALLRASGEVEAYCVKGGRYTPTDLAALTGAGQAFLKGLVCDLALYHLAKRRGVPDAAKAVPGYAEAMKMLESLGLGEAIFGFQQVADAGNMDTMDLSQNSAGRLQRITDLAKRRFVRADDVLTSNPITGSP